jgi:ATP-dependent DNA helicase RecQ
MAKAEFSHEALAAQLQQAAEKETRDRAKLDALLAYVSSRECRHRQILHYFGDPAPVPKPCGACDVCAGSARPPTPLTEVQWVALQKILSAVARLDGQCGRVRVAELLKGADTKGIREAALKDHRCFGLLADWKGAEILRWIDALLRDGSLEVTPGAYPLLRLSPRGKEVMWRRAQPVLDLETPSTKVSSAKTKTVRKAAAVGPGDDSLLKALKAWRLRRALQSKLKPYQVLHNRTLEELAVRKPGSEAELAKISGIGPMKLARYGEELLEIIRGTR